MDTLGLISEIKRKIGYQKVPMYMDIHGAYLKTKSSKMPDIVCMETQEDA